MPPTPLDRSRARGAALVYTLVAMVVFIGMASLAVDLGRVRVVKNQLQHASDAAARYGAVGLATSVSTALNNAAAAASDNTADGSTVVLNSARDIELGAWDPGNQTFTVLTGAARSSANAVRVSARRTAADGNAVPLLLGQSIGQKTCDVTTSSIAAVDVSVPGAFVGLGSFTVKNNTFIGSYNSAVTTNPSHATADSSGGVGSNGAISAGNNSDLYGSTVLGPSGSETGLTVHGSNNALGAAIPTPLLTSWSPGTNPGAIPQVYSVSGTTTLAGGNYWFTSLTVTGTLQFSGPARVYVNGPITVDGTLQPTDSVPAHLEIYQYGSNTFGDTNGNGISITADVHAPSSNFFAKNNLTFRGRGIFNSMDAKNNADFYYDEALGNALTANITVYTVR